MPVLVTSSKTGAKKTYDVSVERLTKLWEETYEEPLDERLQQVWRKGFRERVPSYKYLLHIQYPYSKFPSIMNVLGEYLANPTTKTARDLLKSLHYPIPWENWDEKMTQKKIRTNVSMVFASPIVCKGGGERMELSDRLQQAMVIMDGYHDLLGKCPEQVREWVLRQQSEFPHSPPSEEYTKAVGNMWIRKAGADPKLFYSRKRHNGKFTHAEDYELLRKFRSWVCKEKLTILLDGIQNDLADVNTIAQTAFLLLMFENGTKVMRQSVKLQMDGKMESKVKHIDILDGTFHVLDHGSVLLPFLQVWVDSFAKLIQGKIQIIDVTSQTPIASKYYTRTNIDEEGMVKLPNGRVVDVNLGEYWVCRQGLSALHLPFTKFQLAECMRKIQTTTLTAQEAQFVRDALEVNFFRDAYKVDVALQKDAIFLTKDRLAFTFHSLLAQSHRLPPHGLYMNACLPNDCERAEIEFACVLSPK